MSMAAFEAVLDSDSTAVDFIIEPMWIWIRVPGWDSTFWTGGPAHARRRGDWIYSLLDHSSSNWGRIHQQRLA